MREVLLGAALEALGDIVHHGRRSALNLISKRIVLAGTHGIVDGVSQRPRALPHFQVFKTFREAHVSR